jgi:hypothetical protein
MRLRGPGRKIWSLPESRGVAELYPFSSCSAKEGENHMTRRMLYLAVVIAAAVAVASVVALSAVSKKRRLPSRARTAGKPMRAGTDATPRSTLSK